MPNFLSWQKTTMTNPQLFSICKSFWSKPFVQSCLQ